tara:strand:+ start:192 stop:458 length:267 start_codon:yes stop_codon:yes gene_type:complete
MSGLSELPPDIKINPIPIIISESIRIIYLFLSNRNCFFLINYQTNLSFKYLWVIKYELRKDEKTPNVIIKNTNEIMLFNFIKSLKSSN